MFGQQHSTPWYGRSSARIGPIRAAAHDHVFFSWSQNLQSSIQDLHDIEHVAPHTHLKKTRTTRQQQQAPAGFFRAFNGSACCVSGAPSTSPFLAPGSGWHGKSFAMACARAAAAVACAVLLCSAPASAVDRGNFKTCDQSSFCKRNRGMTVRWPAGAASHARGARLAIEMRSPKRKCGAPEPSSLRTRVVVWQVPTEGWGSD